MSQSVHRSMMHPYLPYISPISPLYLPIYLPYISTGTTQLRFGDDFGLSLFKLSLRKLLPDGLTQWRRDFGNPEAVDAAATARAGREDAAEEGGEEGEAADEGGELQAEEEGGGAPEDEGSEEADEDAEAG